MITLSVETKIHHEQKHQNGYSCYWASIFSQPYLGRSNGAIGTSRLFVWRRRP